MKQNHMPTVFALLVALFLSSLSTQSLARAQEQPAEKTVIKRLMHIEPKDLASTLSLLDVPFVPVPKQRSVVLRTDEATMKVALQLIENLDIPLVSAESLSFRLSILKASKEGATNVPADLEKVASQLGEVLGYDSFELIETVLLRTTNHSVTGAEGGLPLESELGSHYSLSFRPRLVSRPDSNLLRLEDLKLRTWKSATSSEGKTYDKSLVSMGTNVEVKVGQTAVVGKATPVSGSAALVLVVQGELLN